MEIISRKDAKALGLKKYFTNEPCTRGHVAERWVNGKNCTLCRVYTNSLKDKKEYDKNFRIKRLKESPHYFRQVGALYKKRHPEKVKKDALDSYHKNKNLEKERILDKEYYQRNKEAMVKKAKEFRLKNKDKINARRREQRALAKQEKQPT